MPIRATLAWGMALLWPCQAQAAEPSNWTLSGELDLVSDYRFRGVSQTDLDPALQPSLTLSHKSGFYVATWSSNIRKTEGGARAEIDLSGGFEWERGATSLDLSVTYYTYPGDWSLNYAEASAVLTYAAGPFQPHLTLAYVPPQSATRLETGRRVDNVYVAVGTEFEVRHTPLTLSAQIGYERGFFDYSERGSKIDWELGAAVKFDKVDVRISYVDSNRRVPEGHSNLGGAGVVAQLGFSF